METPRNPLSVLLLEDSASMRMLMQAVAAQDDREVVTAETGDEAWKICRERSFDIYLLDWVVPGDIDGIELCRRIRQKEREFRSHIIIITGRSESKAIEELIAVGADEYIAKPFNPIDLDVRLKLAQNRCLVERAQAESDRELRERDSKIRAIVETASNAIIMIGKKGEIELFNPAAEKMFGYTSDEILGQSVKTLAFGENREHIDEYLERASRNGPSKMLGRFREVVASRKDGSTFPALLGTSATVADGEIVGFTGIMRDLTQEKCDRARMIELQEKAHEAEKAKSKAEFFAGMSHEIRTPMGGVIGTLDLLKETELDDEQSELVETAHRAAENMITIINDILDFSKIEAGKMTVESLDVNLQGVIRDVVRLLSVKASEKNIGLYTDLSETLPSVIQCDPVRLTQILINLAGNAIKFTDEGRVLIRVSHDDLEDGSILLRFMVIDSGIGIAEEHIEKLFESYTQAEESTTRRFGGTGLGLSISKSLVDAFGGSIGVESIVGEGSTFWFTIPSRPGAIAPVEAAKIDDRTHFEDLSVLVAEDNEINRRIAEKMLQAIGASVDLVENGVEAIEACSKKHYDIIFMDQNMPEMDGLEATRALRARSSTAETPILALTASILDEDRTACIDAGMNDFLTKPVRREDLIQAIQHHCPTIAARS